MSSVLMSVEAGWQKCREAKGCRAYKIGGIAAGAHGGVPHYHKERVAAEWFPHYLKGHVPQVVRCDDLGDPMTGALDDGKAKRVHIKR